MELTITGSANKLSVSDEVFGREFSEDLVHQVVVAYRNAGRAGTKAQKTRAEVNGTTKKSKKQKGGGARHGALTAPIFVGGGVTFAAKPRSFAQKVNRKMYRAAISSILSELNRQNRLKVVEAFDVDATKTSALIEKLKGFDLGKPGVEARRPRRRQAPADRDRGRQREPVPVRPQSSLRGSARRAGPGSGSAGRCRLRADHGRRHQEDRGVAGMISNEKIFAVLRAPRVSEKTVRLQELSNQYVFEVSNDATKADVKAAVEQLFDVKVETVNVVNVKGKNKSFRNRAGRRGDWRKAYVRLADGQAIDVSAKA